MKLTKEHVDNLQLDGSTRLYGMFLRGSRSINSYRAPSSTPREAYLRTPKYKVLQSDIITCMQPGFSNSETNSIEVCLDDILDYYKECPRYVTFVVDNSYGDIYSITKPINVAEMVILIGEKVSRLVECERQFDDFMHENYSENIRLLLLNLHKPISTIVPMVVSFYTEILVGTFLVTKRNNVNNRKTTANGSSYSEYIGSQLMTLLSSLFPIDSLTNTVIKSSLNIDVSRLLEKDALYNKLKEILYPSTYTLSNNDILALKSAENIVLDIYLCYNILRSLLINFANSMFLGMNIVSDLLDLLKTPDLKDYSTILLLLSNYNSSYTSNIISNILSGTNNSANAIIQRNLANINYVFSNSCELDNVKKELKNDSIPLQILANIIINGSYTSSTSNKAKLILEFLKTRDKYLSVYSISFLPCILSINYFGNIFARNGSHDIKVKCKDFKNIDLATEYKEWRDNHARMSLT